MIEKLFQESTHVDNLSKDSFRELLTGTMSKSLMLFDQEFCKQHDEVTISFPLGLHFPIFFLLLFCYPEKIWFQNYPSEFKPVIYRRYVCNTFLLLAKNITSKKFKTI